MMSATGFPTTETTAMMPGVVASHPNPNPNTNEGMMPPQPPHQAPQQQQQLQGQLQQQQQAHMQQCQQQQVGHEQQQQQEQQQQRQEGPQEQQNYCRFSDIVDRIVIAAEARQALHETAVGVDFDGSGGGGGAGAAAVQPAEDGGPLTAQELAQLSVLCASSSSSSSAIPDPPVSSSQPNPPRPGTDGTAATGDSQKSTTPPPRTSSWATVEGDQLASLASMLEEHVASASHVDMIGEAVDVIEGSSGVTIDQWLSPKGNSRQCGSDNPIGAGHHRLQVLRRGLESASVLLSIMCNPDVDRRAVTDDAISSCLALLKQHLTGNVVSSLSEQINPAGGGGGGSTTPKKTPKSTRKKKRRRSGKGSDDIDESSLLGEDGPDEIEPSDEDDEGGGGTKSKGGRRRSSVINGGKRTMTKQMKTSMRKVFRPVLSTIGLLVTFMERVEHFIRAVQLDDQPILSIATCALSTLTVEVPAYVASGGAGGIGGSSSLCHLVQISALRMVTAVFRRYPRHRSIVLEDLFPLMLKLPTSKRSLRTYPLRQQMSTPQHDPRSSSSKSLMMGSTSALKNALAVSPYPTASTSPVPQGLVAGASIQVVTALILSLVQCCVVMPHPMDDDDDDDSGDSDGQGKKGKKKATKGKAGGGGGLLPRLTSGLLGSQSACDFLAAQMLQRCSRKGLDGGASEFRPILFNLIDDLLLVQLFPEYPAADMLLLAFGRGVSSDLLRCSRGMSRGGKDGSLETTYIATAMDVLGKICAATAGHVRYNREHPLRLSKATDGGDVNAAPLNDATEVNRCFCGRVNLVETFMLDCDRCHAWFHGTCVGVTKDNLPQVWLCDECSLQVIVLEQAKEFAARCRGRRRGKTANFPPADADDAPDIDETHVFRQLLLNHLTRLASSHPDMNVAREFHLAKWVQEFELSRGDEGGPKTTTDTFDAEVMCAHFMDQWNPTPTRASDPESSVGSYAGAAHHRHHRLSDEGNAKIMRALAATSSDLTNCFPRLLGVMVKLMAADDQVALRKMSVKAISQVIQIDSSLMVQPAVRKAVAQRFLDEAISVREAAVSLVGGYVLKSPMVADAFHTSLLARLGDVGKSVRRRTVLIFHDILLSQPNYSGRVAACTSLLQRAADLKEEDSVRDLIHSTFQELWFDGEISVEMIDGGLPTARADQNEVGGIGETDRVDGGALAGVVTPVTPMPSNAMSEQASGRYASHGNTKSSSRRRRNGAVIAAERRRDRCIAAATQMVDVVAESGNADFLSALVKDLLFGLGEGDKDSKMKERQKRREAAEAHCARLVSALIDALLSFEENRSRVASQSEEKGSSDRRLVALISTLGVFCESSPALLAPHLDTMLPYLKADNLVSMEQEAKILTIVSKIVTRVSPILTEADLMSLIEGNVGDDFVQITYKFGSAASAAAVEALASLSRCVVDSSTNLAPRRKLMKLAAVFYSYLYKSKDLTEDFSTVTRSVHNNIQRACSVLGAICQHHEKDLDRSALTVHDETTDINPTACPFMEPKSLSWENLSNACFAGFSFYLNKKDVATKCASVRALTCVFIARPRVMLAVERTGVIRGIMSDESHPQLQLEALRCWTEILIAEEERVESGEAKQRMDQDKKITLSRKISGDQDGDASIVGSVLTQHASRLYEMTTSPHPAIRLASLDLIGQLLRQGLLNPMETVPHLLALQGDVRNPSIRLLALKLLIAEGDKRPDMLRQRVCAGVQRAYKFQRLVNPNATHVTAVVVESKDASGIHGQSVECIFGSIYKESLSKSKVQKQALFKSLIGLFGTTGIGETDNINDDCVDSTEVSSKTSKNKRARSRIGRKAGGDSKKRVSFVERLPMLCYAAQILAHLPYTASIDPLFIIHHVSSITAVQGAPLLDRFAAFLSQYNEGDEDDNIENVREDDLEHAAKAKNSTKTQAAAFLNKENFDVKRFSELCAEASALVLLMRLKLFLRKVYALNETRCLEFNPNEKETIQDKSISLPERMPVFNNRIEGGFLFAVPEGDNADVAKRLLNAKKDACIKQYAEFRKLMRSGDVGMAKLTITGSGLEGDGDTLGNIGASTKRKKSDASKKGRADAAKKPRLPQREHNDGDSSSEYFGSP